MAFINEKISEDDKVKISSVINYENLKTLARWITEFSEPSSRWAVDRERNVYILFVIGGGREQLDYYALGIDGQAVVFNIDKVGSGNDTIGIKGHWNVYDLRIPLNLESRKEEIKRLICEGLEELAHFKPFVDGGTPSNPNIVARWNIISFEVEFK